MNARIKELENGQVLIMSANSSATWAALNGFSTDIYEVEQDDAGNYYLAGQVPQASLEELQTQAKEQVENYKNSALQGPSEIEIEGLGTVLYDQQAVINISSLILLESEEAETFILADDSTTTVTNEQVRAIGLAFKAHVESIYATKISLFAAIDACTSITELESLELPTSD